VPVDRFLTLLGKYEKEQADIKKRLVELSRLLVENKSGTNSALELLQAVQIYTDAETLTRQMLLDLVDKIVVHEGEGFGKSRKQKIEVYFRFVGAGIQIPESLASQGGFPAAGEGVWGGAPFKEFVS
jgi:hypothetical protein